MGGLLERDEAMAALTAALDAAMAGRGGVATIEGPPGIGKTRLLAALREAAAEEGVRALAARPSELEQDVPFAVAGQLLEPALRELGTGARADLLAIRGGDEVGEFARLDGLARLTFGLAEAAPLLVAVDDAQWCDVASLRFLAHLARRLDGRPILLCLATRAQPAGERRLLLDHVALAAGAPAVRLLPLGEAASARLLAEALGEQAGPEFAAGCHRACGGNPLLLLELARALHAAGVAPRDSETGAVERIGPGALATTVRMRLATISAAARSLLEAASILGDGTSLEAAGELADLEDHGEAVAELVLHDVLLPGPRVEFVHPLVREAVLDGLDQGRRRALHAGAAALLAARAAPDAEVARHLLACGGAAGIDALGHLRRAGEAAVRGGDLEAAAEFLEAAVAAADDRALRGELLLELAAAQRFLDRDAAATRARQAIPLLAAGPSRARALTLLAAMLPSDHPREAIRTGLEAIAELGGADPEARRRLEATVLTGALIGSERPPSELLDAAAGQCGEGAPSGRMMAAVLAYHRALAGGTADEVAELMELGFGDGWQPDAGLIGAQLTLGLIALGAADERRAELLCADWLATARQRGSLLGVAGAQMISAHLRLARGEVEPAAADAREALELVATAGVDGAASGHAAAALATALIAADRLDAARDVIAPHCHGTGPLAHQGPVAARARLLAAAGDGEAALAEWLRIGELSRRRPVDNPVLLPWRSEAARLLAELGREPERARELAAAELELSRHWGRPRPIGVALGAVALTADGAARITLAEESVETLRAAGAPLELGRALTDLGGILAATDRRAAREPLREALELLGETGAEHLRRRAHRELVAAGGRPRREASAGPASLTPQERRVATLAATGAGNREIAAELVLAVRTIESHLAGAYRKLGVSSRSQLRDALAP